MKSVVAALLVGSAAAFTSSSFNGAQVKSSASNGKKMAMETIEDLETLGTKLNPAIKYFDPLGLAKEEFWGTTNEETIGFLREAEIKHGRIAMFAFVGYIVHANGIAFPWAMNFDDEPFPKVSSAPEAWDALPDAAKLQIIAFIGFLEFYREVGSETHYMKGGKPGEFPAFDVSVIPGGALNLYDPFGIAAKNSPEKKERGLTKELNNGRLAMIGIMGFCAEGKVEGSVPFLKGIIPHYDGDFMAPFDTSLFPSVP
mmetsp:Transcript_3608/g.8034  ORF Transcript_3608/g.8034 Transcript_3608/m.8034 type:complete len:256 (+) Transcript_3608:60-827(+)